MDSSSSFKCASNFSEPRSLHDTEHRSLVADHRGLLTSIVGDGELTVNGHVAAANLF